MTRTGTAVGTTRDSRLIGFGVLITFAVHVFVAAVLATATGTPETEGTRFPIERRLCDGLRCPEKRDLMDRREPDEGPVADLGVIEAAVVPMLGLDEPRPNEFPKLVKYEQPEKVEEAVNVNRDNPDSKEVPNQEVKPKKAEIDRTRKDRSLAALLGAPEDDDPRKRATSLAKIIGSRDGSVYGGSMTGATGNLYAGNVALAIRQQFTIPPFLGEAELKTLRVRVRVLKMDAAGRILEYEIQERSANPGFNAASLAAIRKFVPNEGGNAYLPSPDETTLAYINSKGMTVDLDGALFRK